MSALADAAIDYVALRRAVGFKLVGIARSLADFVAFAETNGDGTVTVALALAWAGGKGGNARQVAVRLSTVRGFARYLQAQCRDHEVPPAWLLPIGKGVRRVPYLYSSGDIAAMMQAARNLDPALWASTVETVLGLLFATGMRIGEVLALGEDDVDWDIGTLTVRLAKFNKSRLIPLTASTLEALDAYLVRRRTLCPKVPTSAIFVNARGKRLTYNAFSKAFAVILDEAGVCSVAKRPRIHDLRHSFAVATLLEWYRAGLDVQPLLPRLSVYLGHVNPASTYWYLSGSPELMALAADRLESNRGETNGEWS